MYPCRLPHAPADRTSSAAGLIGAGFAGRLRYVVVELKAVPFSPAFVGQMNLYLSAVDDLMRHPDDAPTIGLLLCKGKDRMVVEYALRDLAKPLGVVDWETRLVDILPDDLKGSLPTIEEIEAELRE